MNQESKTQNLLILGASGALAHSTLVYLKNHRSLFDKLILSDQKEFHQDNFEKLSELNAEFIKFYIDSKNKKAFLDLLTKTSPDIVLDLSNAPTEFVAEVIFEYGKASYICCAFCTESFSPLGEALNDWIDKQQKKSKPNLPHIFFTGMNPGSVNIWAAIGAKKFGIPKEITEFEYDTSRFMKKHKEKMVTWCVPEFIVELVTDPAEIILGDHKIKSMYPNGLYHQEDLKHLFEPILKLDHYPKGCVVTHEECVTLGNRWNIPMKFLYTVNQETIRHIKRIYDENGKIEEKDLVLGKNFDDPLVGSDNIAMRLEYEDKAVYFFNSACNENLKECSGTDFQVTIGVYAALFTLLQNDLQGGIYYAEDLLDTFFPKFLTDNMMIQEFVLEKDEKGNLNLTSHEPHISFGKGSFIKL